MQTSCRVEYVEGFQQKEYELSTKSSHFPQVHSLQTKYISTWLSVCSNQYESWGEGNPGIHHGKLGYLSPQDHDWHIGSVMYCNGFQREPGLYYFKFH